MPDTPTLQLRPTEVTDLPTLFQVFFITPAINTGYSLYSENIFELVGEDAGHWMVITTEVTLFRKVTPGDSGILHFRHCGNQTMFGHHLF
jgi:hypothetical protein